MAGGSIGEVPVIEMVGPAGAYDPQPTCDALAMDGALETVSCGLVTFQPEITVATVSVSDAAGKQSQRFHTFGPNQFLLKH